MKLMRVTYSYQRMPLFVISAITALILAGGCASIEKLSTSSLARSSSLPHLNNGYGVLKLFLEDEQYLTLIRRTNAVLTFKGISETSRKLIDEIADASEQALDEMEQQAALKPNIVFEQFSDDSIGKATLDSLRIEIAKEFLFDTKDFEKNMLLSQSQILRVISHLAMQLEGMETNSKRKAWLKKLSQRYDDYYQKVFALIIISNTSHA